MPWTDTTYTQTVGDPPSTFTAHGHWPPQVGDALQIWDYIIQRKRALAERYAVAAGAYFGNQIVFPAANIWDAGASVTSATDNGDGTATFHFTLNAQNVINWGVDCAADPPPAHRWVGFVCIPPGSGGQQICVPSEYDLVIDPVGALIDPSKVFKGTILDQTLVNNGGTPVTGTGTLKVYIGPISDMITAKILTALSDLVGKPWYITTSHGQGGVYSSDRIPIKPLGRSLWAGNAAIGSMGPWPADQKTYLAAVAATPAGGTPPPSPTQYSILTDTTAGWGVDRWKNKELLFRDIRLKRVAIAHNDNANLYLPLATYSVSNPAYCIVEVGTKADPDWPADCPIRWYTGRGDGYISHSVIDSQSPFGGLILAAPTISITVLGDDGECSETEYPPIFDQPDLTYDQTNVCECGNAGLFYQPYFWKSDHADQIGIMNICTAFVPVASYDGAKAIPLYSFAKLMKDIGADNGTTTLTHVDGGGLQFTVPSSVVGFILYWGAYTPDGDLFASGAGVVPSSGIIGLADVNPTAAGGQVIYSRGWTRFYKRRVKFVYDSVTNFIPDTDDLGGLIDPPDVKKDTDEDGDDLDSYNCNGAGVFVRRPKSTNYGLFDQFGEFIDDAGPAFVDGELAVHEGENEKASALPPKTGFSNPAPPIMTYWDRMFRGTYAPPLQRKRERSRTGKLIGTTKYSITTDQNWWQDGVNGGTMRIESSTATSGDSTSLTDTTRNTADPNQKWKCFYSVDRFATGHAPYVGWILEVDKTYSGTDLAVDTSNALKVASASHPFIYAEVGSKLTVTGGTGWTAGDYTIKSIDTGGPTSGAATLDKSPAPVGTGAGSWTMTVTYKMVIDTFTDHHGTGGVTFGLTAPDGFSVAASNPWRIRETYAGDKWVDRDLVLDWVDDAGVAQELIVPIRHNDNSTLFFDAQSHVIPITASWQIREKSYGHVWKWSAAKNTWVVPPLHVGDTDPVSQAERWYQNKIEPKYVKDYGPIRNGDYPGPHINREMYDAINKLLWTKSGVTWDSRSNPNVAENNFNGGSVGDAFWPQNPDPTNYPDQSTSIYQPSYSAAVDACRGQMNDPANQTPSEVRGTAPGTDTYFEYDVAFQDGEYVHENVPQGSTVHTRAASNYAYAAADVVTAPLTFEAEFFIKGGPTAPDGSYINHDVFSDNGTGIYNGSFKKFDTEPGDQSSGRPVRSGQFGTTSIQELDELPEPAPPSPTGYSATSDDADIGFVTVDACAILKWAFDFVDPFDTDDDD